MNDATNRQVSRIFACTGSEILRELCLRCGESLEIGYVRLEHFQHTALHIQCDSCGRKLIVDGEFDAPPWVAELGRCINTGDGGYKNSPHIRRLLKCEAAEAEYYACHKCSGRLRLDYEESPYRQGMMFRRLEVECLSCHRRARYLWLDESPPWVQVLGNQFATQEK